MRLAYDDNRLDTTTMRLAYDDNPQATVQLPLGRRKAESGRARGRPLSKD